jgi:hypothetical protein
MRQHFAPKPPFVDVRPRTIVIAFLIDESKLVDALFGPCHPPFAVDSDDRHQTGENDLIADPALC